MQIPDALRDRLPFLEILENEWDRVPQAALIAWIIFYGFFLYQAARGAGILLLMDAVFILIHEGGHILFRFFGEYISAAGGTFLQLAVPLMLATYFFFQRQAQGVAFCLFFLFEQFLPIATYMADARAQELPLLTIGDGDYVIHDWNYLFGKLGLLQHDTQIAATVRLIGWTGMLAAAAWLVWRGTRSTAIADGHG